MKTLLRIMLKGLAKAAIIWPMALHAQGILPGADVESLITYARERNPEYAAMRHEAEAAGERAQSAGALPDPVLRTELQNITNFGNDGSTSILPGRVGSTKYTLMQALPFWGKRDLKREAAEAEAAAAQGRAAGSWTEQTARI